MNQKLLMPLNFAHSTSPTKFIGKSFMCADFSRWVTMLAFTPQLRGQDLPPKLSGKALMIAPENPVPSSLPASERRAAGATIFEVVAVIEKTTVRAGAAPLQTQSGEHSALIDGSQIQSTLQGRNLNGHRQSTPNLTLDGISMMDTGGGTGPYYEPNIDAIAEIKALLTNYRANMSEPRGGAITEFHRKRDKLSFWSEEFMKPQRPLSQLCFETYNTPQPRPVHDPRQQHKL